jgi:signal transduction histidine kinase
MKTGLLQLCIEMFANNAVIIIFLRYIIISVSDNGIGFKEEDAEKILEFFSRLENEKGHYKGSGIGLAVCKKIMEMHGGFIVAEGQPAQGASVNCYFPVN